MPINQLVLELKQNEQDFEFYPTSERMLKIVYDDMYWRDISDKSILDIGCGNCGLFGYIDKANRQTEQYNKNLDWDRKRPIKNFDYYVIEKSKILLGRLKAGIVVLGTDFNEITLIDKKAGIYFCNPPYSEFENWTLRIIKEGNFEYAYLIIPERWKENKFIQKALEVSKVKYEVIGNDNFLDAERSARAKVDIVRFYKDRYSQTTPFDIWFEETFNINSKSERLSEYQKEEQKTQEVNALMLGCESKAETLVNSYNEDMMKLNQAFIAICNIEEDILKEIGVDYEAVKQSLKHKIENLKTFYWKMVFNNLDEITCRLTADSRQELFSRFEKHNQVDFTLSNIESVVIWVIKNANNFYEAQLVNFYKRLSDWENVKPYKSNQKLFQKDDWRFNSKERSHYVLDYRLVVSYLFSASTSWSNEFCNSSNDYENEMLLKDIRAIAKNLGFETKYHEVADDFGQKCYIMMSDGKTPLLEYKIYKNKNTHIKLNIEFAKALNVEVSRILGWIRNKDDIVQEFPDEMAKGADKYFNSNVNFRLTNNNIKLLA